MNTERKLRTPCTGTPGKESHPGSPYELGKDGKMRSICTHYRDGSCVAGVKHRNAKHTHCNSGEQE